MQHAFHPSALKRISSVTRSAREDEMTSEWDLDKLAKDIQRNTDWVSEGYLSIDLERAMAMLAERL